MEYATAQPEDPLAALWAASAEPVQPATTARHPSAAVLDTTLSGSAKLWRTEELLDRGLSARQIRQLTGSGAIFKLRRGCYVRRSFWVTLDANGASLCRIEAYAHRCLTSSTGTYVFSHTTAARLHGLFLWQVDDTIHLTVPFLPSSGGHAGDVKAHTRALAPADILHVAGHRVTSLVRTAADSCLVLNYSQGLILVDHALRIGASRDALELECARLRGAPGVATLKKVLAHADPRSESPGETLSRDLFRRLRIPAPELQFEVRTRLGTHRLDFAWPEQRVAGEFDGRRKYFDYQPTAEAIFAERRREKALMELGWKFIRLEWRDLFREQELKARLLRLLAG